MAERSEEMRNKRIPKSEEELLAWLRSHFAKGKDPLLELSEHFSSPKGKLSDFRNWNDEEA